MKPVHCFCRNRFTKRTPAIAQKNKPAWYRNIPTTNRALPNALVSGVSVQGVRPQTGAVSATAITTRVIPLESRTDNESGIVSSSERLESYHIFSTDARWVNILTGEKTRRIPPAKNCNPDILRKRRPEVSTRSHNPTNRP